LKRAIQWAGGVESADGAVHWDTTCPDIESTYFPETGKCLLINNAREVREFEFKDGSGTQHKIHMEPFGLVGYAVEDDKLKGQL
jgi:hypothetical protein